MQSVTFSQVESQLPFFSDEQLESIAEKIKNLLARTKKDPFYSASNMKALSESDEQIKSGRIVVKTMQELEAMANG